MAGFYRRAMFKPLHAVRPTTNANFPLRFFTFYLLFSLVIYAFGPWPWPSRETWTIYVFMALVLAVMHLGYRHGTRRTPHQYCGRASLRKLYQVGMLLSLFFFFPTLFWRTGGGGFDLALLTDPAALYALSHDQERFSGAAWIEYLRIVFSVYLYLVLPLLFILWRQLSLLERIGGLLSIGMEVVLWLAVGTNKGIGDLFILIFWIVALGQRGYFTRRALVRAAQLVLPGIVLFFVFFTIGQIGRHDGERVQAVFHVINIEADRDNLFVRHLPPLAQEGVIAFSSYLVQGYHGLSLSLKEPFAPTWGFGHSRFLATYSDKYLGTNVARTTYASRVEAATGWDADVRWHTMFPWFASDITFAGAILLVYFFAFLLARTWREAAESRNPYAIALFLQLTILFTYMTANNQAFQSGPALSGFWVSLFLWLRTRRRTTTYPVSPVVRSD